MNQQKSGPGRVGYLISIAVFVLGAIAGSALIGYFIVQLMAIGDDFERFTVPGTHQVEISETGTYTIYYEYESTVNDVDYSTSQTPPQMEFQITRLDDGQQIQVRRPSGSTSYSSGSYSGASYRSFSADETGTYEITVEYVDGSTDPAVVIAVGEGLGTTIVTSIGAVFAGGIVFCLMTLVALAIAVVTLLRRRRVDQQPAPGHQR